MIINYDFYYCYECHKAQSFDTSKPYSKLCPICGKEMKFEHNADGDTERTKKVANTPPLVVKIDNEPQKPARPIVRCPYCKSTATRKISGISKAAHLWFFGIFGIGKAGKQWHCYNCNSDF